MVDCIFCSIARKEVKSYMIYEDEEFMAFLDIMPRSEGMFLVAPKKHVTDVLSYEKANQLFELSLKLAKHAKEKLKREIYIAVIPTTTGHAAIRVYPVKDEAPLIENKPLQMDESKLEELANILKYEEGHEEPKTGSEEIEHKRILKSEWEFA